MQTGIQMAAEARQKQIADGFTDGHLAEHVDTLLLITKARLRLQQWAGATDKRQVLADAAAILISAIDRENLIEQHNKK